MGIDCGQKEERQLYIDPAKPIYCFKSINAHDNKIACIIQLFSGKIATGSYDHKIKIWNVFNFECEKTIQEKGNVLCLLQYKHNLLLSGTDKNTIQLWDINSPNNNSLCEYKGHSLWVNCLTKCDEDYFASCSNDSDIRIWNINSSNSVNILRGHTECALALIRLNNGKLCSGSADLTIKIWNWQEAVCEMTLDDSDDWIKCLYLLGNGYLLSGLGDGTIQVWCNENKIGNFKGHDRAIRAFCQIDDYHYASTSFDQTIKIWKINNNKYINILKGHTSYVIGILYHQLSGYLITCSNDKTIKFWKNQ